MNPRHLGQSIRRGVIVGAITGFLAGWGAFAVRDGIGTANASAPSPTGTVSPPSVATPALPPVPRAPTLAPVPTVAAGQIGAGDVAPPPPVPTLQPLPTLPPISVQPRAVTRTS